MMIHEITPMVGKYKARKRIGRGRGSGMGKTSGRGHNGARSRSGYSARFQFEGGQTPYFRRIKKTGFTNANFKTHFWTVNLGDILSLPQFAKGGTVDQQTLVDAGIIRDMSRPMKILGDLGDHAEKGVAVKFEITSARVTDSVREKVIAAGGTVTEIGTRRDNIRGIDRNSEDRIPKNLGKKLKRGSAKKKKISEAAARRAD